MPAYKRTGEDTALPARIARPVLAETPAGLRAQGKTEGGFRFFLMNVSRACNQQCPFCWTEQTPEYIQKQTKEERIGWFTDGIAYALLRRFKEREGEIIAVMAEGEPLLGINYRFIQQLARVSSSLGLGMLLFTNGELLTAAALGELNGLNPRTSYSISINAGTPKAFDQATGRNGSYARTMENFENWQEYNRLQPHRIGIHTVISAATNEEEMQRIQAIVERLGAIPWTVTKPGVAGGARIRPGIIPVTALTKRLINRYMTGPTATDPVRNTCSYIVSEWHRDAMFGITFHPFNEGSIQSCPYLSQFGSSNWFTLRGFIESDAGHADEAWIGRWLDYAVLLEAVITTAALNVAGYEHCIMRHGDLPRIESFFAQVNLAMEEVMRQNGFDPKGDGYFTRLIERVAREVHRIARYAFGKEIEVDVERTKVAIGFPD